MHAHRSQTQAPRVDTLSALEIATRVDTLIQETVENPDAYIDEGGAAKVFELDSLVCAKVFRPKDNDPKPGNRASVEASFLDRARAANLPEIRVPRCIGHIEPREGRHAGVVLMERLPAVSLQRVINGEYPSIKSGIDVTLLGNAIEDAVYELHQIGILHNDIEPRNIMIDARADHAGMFYLIDFGQASNVSRDESESRRELHRSLAHVESLRSKLKLAFS